MEFDELYDDQLIYKRTPMDFIDHLWELLSRKIGDNYGSIESFKSTSIDFYNRKLQQLQRTVTEFAVYPSKGQSRPSNGRERFQTLKHYFC